ncbi:DUF3987 domain-containing protein [Planctomycetota bacterium]
MLLARDELSGWLRSMNRYKTKGGADVPFYLSVWSGGPIQVDRKKLKDPLRLPFSFLCVTGTIQPRILSALLTEERHEEGFSSRLLFAYPPTIGRGVYNRIGVDEEQTKPVCDLMETLFALEPDGDYSSPHVVKFSEAGDQVFEENINLIRQEIQDGQLDERMKAHWAKMEGYLARISLILHLVKLHSGETKSDEIEADTVGKAARLLDYFKLHIIRLYLTADVDAQKSKIDRIMNWANRRGKTEIAVRDVIGSHIVSDRREAIQVLDEISKRGMGQWKDEDSKQVFLFTPTQQLSKYDQKEQKVDIMDKSKGMTAMNTTTQQQQKLLLTRLEAAQALGICERTLDTYTKIGEIPSLRVGSRVLYSVQALQVWIQEKSQESA